jgi:hypothetical protein
MNQRGKMTEDDNICFEELVEYWWDCYLCEEEKLWDRLLDIVYD